MEVFTTGIGKKVRISKKTEEEITDKNGDSVTKVSTSDKIYVKPLEGPSYKKENKLDYVEKKQIVEVPPSDNRKYIVRYYKNIKVLIIVDEDTNTGAASFNFTIGSSLDPESKFGDHHYLEHKLFTSEFQDFVSKCFGKTNAYTDHENTVYTCSFIASKTKEVLQMFFSMLFDPKFEGEKGNDERKAVNSEFMKDLTIYGCLLDAVLSQIIRDKKGESPFAKFSVGSLKTLKNVEKKDLQEAFKQYFDQKVFIAIYVDDIDKVKYVDDLIADYQKWTINDEEKGNGPIFDAGQLEPLYGKKIDLFTRKNLRSLLFSFPMPAVFQNPERGDMHLIELAFCLKCNLFRILHEEGFVLSLESGISRNYTCDAEFTVEVNLSEKGAENQYAVIEIVVNFVRCLKKYILEGDEAELQLLADEMIKLGKFQLNRLGKSEPFETVEELVVRFQRCSYDENQLKNLLLGKAGFQNTIENIRAQAEVLDLSKMYVVFTDCSAKEEEFSRTDEYFKQPFNVGELDLNFRPRDYEILSKVNLEGINTDIVVNEPKEIEPELEGKNGFFWVETGTKMDKIILLIKFFLLENPFSAEELLFRQIANIAYAEWSSLKLEKQLEEMWGRDFSFDVSLDGFCVVLSCPKACIAEKKLIGEIKDQLAQMVSLNRMNGEFKKFFVENFDRLKLAMEDDFKNSMKTQPVSKCMNAFYALTSLHSFSVEELYEKLNNVDSHIEFDKRNYKIKALIAGNFEEETKEEASKVFQSLVEQFANPSDDKEIFEDTNIIPKEDIIVEILNKNPDEKNVAVIMCFFAGVAQTAKLKCFEIFIQEIAPVLFREVRTIKNFGYIVGASLKLIKGYVFLVEYVQSENKTEKEIQEELESFNDVRIVEIMNSITKEKWLVLIEDAKLLVKQKDTSIKETFARFWYEVESGRCRTNPKKEQLLALDEIKTISTKESLETIKELFQNSGSVTIKMSLNGSEQSTLKGMPIVKITEPSEDGNSQREVSQIRYDLLQKQSKINYSRPVEKPLVPPTEIETPGPHPQKEVRNKPFLPIEIAVNA